MKTQCGNEHWGQEERKRESERMIDKEEERDGEWKTEQDGDRKQEGGRDEACETELLY